MNLHVKINGVKHSIISFSYRLNNVASDTKISHLFSCIIVAESGAVAVGDTVEFYANDVLVYSDPVNSVVQNGSRFSIQSNKEINTPASKNNKVDTVFYYSSTTIRTPSNFDMVPLDTIETLYGNFTAGTVVHYQFYTEVQIG